MSETKASPLLVIGAGIAGVTAALEAAEMGSEVVLVEQDPTIGGRVLRINNYFPKLCPPSAVLRDGDQHTPSRAESSDPRDDLIQGHRRRED